MDYHDELNPLKLMLETGFDGDDDFSRKIVDCFPAIVYIYDADNRKLQYINGKITDLLGYTHADAENWSSNLLSIVHGEDAEKAEKELSRILSLETDSHCFEVRLTHKHEGCKNFRVQGSIIHRPGNHVSVLFIAQDITGEVETGQNLKRIQELFDDTQEVLKFGVWEWNVADNKMTWSNGLYHLYGYDPSKDKNRLKITPEFYWSHIVEEDREKSLQVRDHMHELDEYEVYYRIRDRHGNLKDVRAKGRVFRNRNKEITRVIGSTMDVTEHLQLYRDLADYKKMKQENEAFLEYGTWEYDVASERFRWSDGMYRLFGYDPEVHRDTIHIDIDLYRKHMDEEEYQKMLNIRKNMLDGRDKKYNWEFRITTLDGNLKKIETFGKLVYDEHNNWIKTVGTSRDVTRLRDYQQSLEEKIRDLNRSNLELEQFAYVASHDMNEPLRKITTFIERLNSKYKEELGEDGRMYLNRIVASAENMRRLIDTLLEFSRTTRNSQPFVMTDLNQVLAEVRSDLELKIEETMAVVEAERLPVVEAVPAQMKQMFDNLLSNSIKFRKPGVPPRITVRCQRIHKKQKDEWNLDKQKTFYKIEFIDNGIGFEPEYREKIFQIFQRLHGKAEYPGSGIGLAICKKITDHMNGSIYATAEPGKGATFTVILPERQ